MILLKNKPALISFCLACLMAVAVWAQQSPTAPGSGTATPGNAPGQTSGDAITDAVNAEANAGIDSAEAAAQHAGELPTLIELFQFSPVINSVLLALSALSLMLFIWFILTINQVSMTPRKLVDDVTKHVVRERYDAARDLCRIRRRTFIATILQRVCENADKDPTIVMNILETEGRRRADVIWNRISYLADIANIAPMIGLLGTVIGMIKAFFALDLSQADASNMSLAQGVGEAMATTLFGLAVAITTSVFYSLIKGRTTRVLADAEQAVHGVADLIGHPENQAGNKAGAVRRVLKKKPTTDGPPSLSTDDEGDHV